MAPPEAGIYNFDVYLKSFNYIDIDIHRTIKVVVKSSEILPKYVAHEEDVELDDEPTLFEQVMSGNVEDTDSEVEFSGSDSDLSDYDLDLTDAQKKRRKARRTKKKDPSTTENAD